MSLFGTLNTAVSGLSAQASYLGTVGDNIANASTVGYKEAGTEFETLLGNQAASSYTSGGVQTRVRYGITDQGNITSTSSVTDLAIKGGGFFVVQSAAGTPALTRAGSFVPDSNGNLVNTAGYTLLGYNLTDGATPSANGTGGLSPVNVSGETLSASPSTTGSLPMNLPSNTAVVTTLPSANTAASTYSGKTSLVAYDNLGNPVTLDIYVSKTAATAAGTPPTDAWQVDVFNHADASAGGGFPYSSGPLTTEPLTFDDTTGSLMPASAQSMTVTIPNGQPIAIDLSKSTQLASAFSPGTPTIDGSAPSSLYNVSIGTDGTVTALYANGIQKSIFQIPLANVPSPNALTPISGNVYQPNLGSGQMTISTANTGDLGEIDSSSLESSTVDIATELTNMIAAQRSYEADSKVIQASSDLLTTITNLHT